MAVFPRWEAAEIDSERCECLCCTVTCLLGIAGCSVQTGLFPVWVCGAVGTGGLRECVVKAHGFGGFSGVFRCFFVGFSLIPWILYCGVCRK